MRKRPILRLVTARELLENKIPPELRAFPRKLRQVLEEYQERFKRPAPPNSKYDWEVPSQRLIAETAGVNSATLSLAINSKGLSKISFVSVVRLANVFGVNVEWLMDRSKDKENQRGPIPPIGWNTPQADRGVG